MVGDELASVEASMRRIRDALGDGILTPILCTAEGVVSGTRQLDTEARSGIDAPRAAEPGAGASRTTRGTRPDPRPDAAPETAGRKKRTGRNATEGPGISARSVPVEVDTRIEAIVATGEFADWPSAAIGLILEALARRAAVTQHAPEAGPESGPDLGTRPAARARPDTPPAILDVADHPIVGQAGSCVVP